MQGEARTFQFNSVDLKEESLIVGSKIISDEQSTTYVAPHWQCVKLKQGHLLLTRI